MKRFLLSLAGISAMLLGSCSQEVGGGLGGEDLGNNGKFRVSVSIENRPGHSASTRAVTATDEEKSINDLYLLFFEPTNDKTGLFVDYIKIDEPTGVGLDQEIDMSDTQLEVTAAYDILAIANIDPSGTVNYLGMTSDAWMQQWSGKTQKEVIAEAQAWTTAGRVASTQLLMSGITKKRENQFKAEVTLLRNQVRLDVVSKAAGYDLVEVGVYNAYGRSKVWNDGSPEGALDYGSDVTRIRDYYKVSNTVTPNPFKPVTDEQNNPIGEKIENYFYVFENMVAQSTRNDALTTCVIVGLRREGSGGQTRYYRANVSLDGEPQNLYRNHAYVVNINSVIGEGHDFLEDAYNDPDESQLNYIVNQWNEDESSVSAQDNNSMISAPYKTVNLELATGNIRGREERGLEPKEFYITTVTSLPSVTELAVIGTPKFLLNGTDPYPFSGDEANPVAGMNIVLDAATKKLKFNNLAVTGQTVRITPANGGAPYDHVLKKEDVIRGSITLGYAGLRITIDVLQSDITPLSIDLYPPSGGLQTFAPFADIMSGIIRVDASGPWTAKIMSESPGAFTFADPVTQATIDGEISRDPEAAGYSNAIAVKTASVNNDENQARVAFIVVALDADKVTYSRFLRVTQAQKANIAIAPTWGSVTFDGTYDPADSDGNGLKGALAGVPNNDKWSFDVMPGTSGSAEGGDLKQNEWEYRIEALVPNTNPSLPGDWTTVYWEKAGTNPTHAAGVVSGQQNRQWFEITSVHPTDLTDITARNTFSVDVKDKNSSGTNRTARIVAFLKGTDPGNPSTAKSYINLVQHSSGMVLSPSSVAAVAKTGGVTPAVSVQSDKSLLWKIVSVTPKYSAAGGRNNSTVNHRIEVLRGSNDEVIAHTGAGTPFTSAETYSVRNETFKVRFPKIMYPNRQINISVTVMVRLFEANGTTPTELTREITFTQSPLTSQGVSVYAPQMLGYGNVYGGSYNHRYIQQIRANFAYPTQSLTVNSNYMHMNYYGLSAGYDWAAVKYYRANRDGVLLVNVDEDTVPAYINMLNNSSSVLTALGYTIQPASGNLGGLQLRLSSDSGTKVYQMIVEGEGGATSNVVGHRPMYIDDVCTYVARMPESAVPIMTGVSGQNIMVIDPKNNLIYQGESQVFDTVDGDSFLGNYITYIRNAAMWGSAFTDLLVEDDQLTVSEEAAGLTEGDHKAPWDPIWGSNAGISR